MKSSRLFLVTLVTVLASGFAVTQAGWLHPRTCRAAGLRRADLTGPERPHDPFAGEAALRYRHCQASHWRACLLQH